MGRRRFGRVRQLASGRWQARYRGADGLDRAAPQTFERRADADRWLSQVELDIVHSDWVNPDAGLVRVSEYATSWVEQRANLRPKTRQLYEGLARLHVVPILGPLSIADVSPARVRSWYAQLIASGVSATTAAKPGCTVSLRC